jgi:murein DD-endopeptidase MepM/ murein hydrolase activator NlpD
VALARTRAAYVNVRTGPGTNYEDIGDIRNNSLVTYYPATQRSDGWLWVEQYTTGGWVSSSVITFEDVETSGPVQPWVATPYDGKIGLWHWRGDSIAENTIEELCETIKKYAPEVKALFVKTSDYTPSTGAQWMGYWDNKRALAIDGPASIDRWVNTLQRYGLEFHAWCVPRGADLERETDLIIQACLRPGVKSMILDVEPYDGFWMGGKDGVRPFMVRIRRAIPGSFHIGLTVDPRPQHYPHIFPNEWYPFVNSVHPQDYWTTFRRTPEAVLEETYRVWGPFGRPIIPALQGDATSTAEMQAAHNLSVTKHKAPGVSWWRVGVIGPTQFAALNQKINFNAPPAVPTTPPPTEQYTDEAVVRPEDPGFSLWSHTGQQEVSQFNGTWGWSVYYKKTEAQTSKVAARWFNAIKENGTYEIAAFVPARHATTRNARYKIHGVKGSSGELLVSINQDINRNAWVKLGVFEIDKNAGNAGTVFLNDLTGEADREIAFDAIRWRRVVAGVPGDTQLADGFDSPVGTLEERRKDKMWPGSWYDASPFGKLYFVGTSAEAYHTGADLNLPRDGDAHTPVYSPASGVVVYAARLPVWGNVVIIRHDPLTPGGVVLYSRLGHVEDISVRVGQRVTRGQQVCKVGNAFGVYAYHLHFDLSPTTVLEVEPNHWPGRSYDGMFRNYIDPKEWILNNRPKNR